MESPNKDYQAISRAARVLVVLSLAHMFTSNWVNLDAKGAGGYDIIHFVTAFGIVVASILIMVEPWK